MIMTLALVLVDFADASAQLYRRENRRGIRAFEEGRCNEAVEHYETALRQDTVNTIPLLYNAAYVLHRDRRDSTKNALKDSLALEYLDRLEKKVAGTEQEYDYHFNRGSMAIDMEDWPRAVDEFKKCMAMNPGDMKAKENYVYAKKHLPENNGGGGQNNQNNQNDQNNQNSQGGQNDQQNDQKNDQKGDDQKNDQKNDQKDDGQQNDQKDDGQDEKQNDQQKDQKDGGKDEQQGGGQQESKISPQAAKQILQAMQAKERETQDKVEKKKAEAMKSKQKEKNW